MATISIPEVLAQNFDEYLTNANGLAFSGECIGGSLLPPLLVVYLDTYGLSGAFFILFGLTSTSIPAALLLNPKYHQKETTISQNSLELLPGHKNSSEAFKVLSSTPRVSNEVFGPDESSMSAETKKLSVAKYSNRRIIISNALQNYGRFSAYQGIFNSNKIYLKTYGIKSRSLESIPTFVSAKTKHMFRPKVPALNTKIIQIDTEKNPHISEQSSKNTLRIEQDILSDLYTEIEEERISSSFNTEESMISHSFTYSYPTKCKNWVFPRKESSNDYLTREQNCSKQYGTLYREIIGDSISENKYSKPLTEPFKQKPGCSFEDTVKKSTPRPDIPSSPRNTSSLEPFRVFLDGAFLFILITQSLILYNSTMFLTIIVDFCKDCGLSSSERVTVLVCASATETFGRIGLGWFTDLDYITNSSFSAVCCLVMSFAFGGLLFVKEVALACILVAVLGFSLGGVSIVGPGVISDHIPEDKRPMALASRFFLYAVLSLSQSPLIGYIRGELGSYYWMFVLLAVICLLASLTSMLTPCAAKCRDKRKAYQKEKIDENASLIKRANPT
ncbi:uncharacterized protein TNIN_162151 [Trichonephila inaurata madagascariensis]|uniref:Uncharacterized protein n=1 Tax=Trichonephila inaurata madagascariensis TaxID=2747483 RepID=A0A8X6YYJ0_9ARAC|nr:uncharacterized protein TNIN_162151 [Trichonephila inaurata madagascariensis]